MTKQEFTTAYKAVSEKARALTELSRREGILALESVLDRDALKERDFFAHGLMFVIDGIDAPLIDKILTNILVQEKDEYARLLMTIEKEALLGIQAGYNPRVLHYLLNSYTDLAEEYDSGFAEGEGIKLIPLTDADGDEDDDGVLGQDEIERLISSVDADADADEDELQYEREEGKYDGET